MTLLRKPISIVWVVLMVATCVSTWMLSEHALGRGLATVAIFLIAAIKVRMVILHFMEVRHAPRPWRVAFEAWTPVVTAVILGIYLASPS